MNLYCISHEFLYETEKLLMLFFPLEKNTVLKEFTGDTGDYFYTEIIERLDVISLRVIVRLMP